MIFQANFPALECNHSAVFIKYMQSVGLLYLCVHTNTMLLYNIPEIAPQFHRWRHWQWNVQRQLLPSIT